ncbi:hypothetical protein E2C01_062201 [Portunus trituberculatus]|uniref:Uncharacterized protein n=1 Tax=Portunus trituberculatus TaxID=210409 RepID=A0A5B7HAB6_PORTR|nr:hypothetical protein [Portunus trituberculatus]
MFPVSLDTGGSSCSVPRLSKRRKEHLPHHDTAATPLKTQRHPALHLTHCPCTTPQHCTSHITPAPHHFTHYSHINHCIPHIPQHSSTYLNTKHPQTHLKHHKTSEKAFQDTDSTHQSTHTLKSLLKISPTHPNIKHSQTHFKHHKTSEKAFQDTDNTQHSKHTPLTHPNTQHPARRTTSQPFLNHSHHTQHSSSTPPAPQHLFQHGLSDTYPIFPEQQVIALRISRLLIQRSTLQTKRRSGEH